MQTREFSADSHLNEGEVISFFSLSIQLNTSDFKWHSSVAFCSHQCSLHEIKAKFSEDTKKEFLSRFAV